MGKPDLSLSKWIKIVLLCISTILIFGILVFIYSRFENPYKSNQVQKLDDGWTYQREQDSSPIKVDDLQNKYIPLKRNETVVLHRVINENIKDGVIYLFNDYYFIKIYLNDILIFDSKIDANTSDPIKSNCYVPLPLNYTGKELRIEASSPYILYACIPSPPYLGDMASLQAHIIKEKAQTIVIAFILVLSGILFLVFSIFVSTKYPDTIQWGQFFFGVSSIVVALSMLTENEIWTFIFPNKLASLLDFIFWAIFPLPFLIWLFALCKKCKIAMLILVVVHAFSFISSFIFAFAGICDLPDFLVFLNPIYIFITLSATILFVIEWLCKNKIIRFISPGMGLLLISAILSAIDLQVFYKEKELFRVGGLILLVILMWIYHMREYLGHQKEREKTIQVFSIKQSLAIESLEAANRYIKESNAKRHEFNHHLTALKSLSDENNGDGIAKYLKKLMADVSSTVYLLYCENTLVNSILCKYAGDCQREEITFTIDAFVPKELPFAENDICTLLMNILDNALEACQKLQSNKRWIRMQVRKKENFLVISCENSWEGNMLQQIIGVYETTKLDTTLHGFGISMMRKVAEKYESVLNTHADEEVFSVKTALRFPS